MNYQKFKEPINMNEKYEFETSYNGEKLAKIAKYEYKKIRKNNKFILSFMLSLTVLYIIIIALQQNINLIIFVILFLMFAFLSGVTLYKTSPKGIKKKKKKNKDIYPLKVKITFDDEIYLYNELTFGNGQAMYKYSSIIDKQVFDDIVFIKFVDKKFVAFEASNPNEIIEFLEYKINNYGKEKDEDDGYLG